MWTSHIPAYCSRALFFHSESLLRHTLEEAGYNEKMKKKKTTVWQWHNPQCRQVSRAGHPGTMENTHQRQSCLAFAAQSQKGAAFPDRALVQTCWAECSQDSQVSLITMIFHYAVPDTLDSAQSFLREVLKILYKENNIELDLVWEVFQVKLVAKGF